MKKAIVQHRETIISCPYCKESRTLMLIISRGLFVGHGVDYADTGDTITCVSCKKEFER